MTFCRSGNFATLLIKSKNIFIVIDFAELMPDLAQHFDNFKFSETNFRNYSFSRMNNSFASLAVSHKVTMGVEIELNREFVLLEY